MIQTIVVVVVVVVAAAAAAAVSVMFTHSHCYRKNSHEHAKEEKSYALLKSSSWVDGEMQRQTVGHRRVIGLQLIGIVTHIFDILKANYFREFLSIK